jgi:hypothetical protein
MDILMWTSLLSTTLSNYPILVLSYRQTRAISPYVTPLTAIIVSDNVTLNIDGVLYLRVQDPYKARCRFCETSISAVKFSDKCLPLTFVYLITFFQILRFYQVAKANFCRAIFDRLNYYL